jgi:thymidylate kinase
MIILITGPTGSGKTDTCWELMKQFDSIVFLDCDWFANFKPFSWQNQSDVELVYAAIATMIVFHAQNNKSNFVVTLTLEMAQRYNQMRTYFEDFGMPIRGFRLTCAPDEAQRRIKLRDRMESQKNEELDNTRIQQQMFERLFLADAFFVKIDNTMLTEEETALKIKEIACGHGDLKQI